jgi:hypothetical protein
VGLLNPGGPIAQSKRNDCSISPVELISLSGVRTFVVAAREMNVSENLIICVHPSDFANKNLHWDDLCDYLRYTCKYVNQQMGRPEGNPEDEHNGIPENVVLF